MKCQYETGKMSGLDCPCEECAKIRDMLFQKELDGTIFISGTRKDKEKLKR